MDKARTDQIMHRIAPSEKDTAATILEKRLWDAADTTARVSAKTKLAEPDRRSVGETELHYLWIQLFHSALNEKGSAGFVMANTTKSAHSCSMKITEDVRNYAAEQGIAEDEALKRGMEAKSKEFLENGGGAEVYARQHED